MRIILHPAVREAISKSAGKVREKCGNAGKSFILLFVLAVSSASAQQYTPPGGLSNPMTNIGDMIAATTGGTPAHVPANTATAPLCLVETGTGTAGQIPTFSTCPTTGTLTYYLQNSIVASGSYVSGGSATGSGTCTLTAFNGGGTGAAATVGVTSGTIAGALTITA